MLSEVIFTKGRIIVLGKVVSRGQPKRADYVLSIKPNIQIGVIETKDITYAAGAGMQRALEYSEPCKSRSYSRRMVTFPSSTIASFPATLSERRWRSASFDRWQTSG